MNDILKTLGAAERQLSESCGMINKILWKSCHCLSTIESAKMVMNRNRVAREDLMSLISEWPEKGNDLIREASDKSITIAGRQCGKTGLQNSILESMTDREIRIRIIESEMAAAMTWMKFDTVSAERELSLGGWKSDWDGAMRRTLVQYTNARSRLLEILNGESEVPREPLSLMEIELEAVDQMERDDCWMEHPNWPREDWRYEVGNKDTNLGYWDWIRHQIEAQYHDHGNLPEESKT